MNQSITDQHETIPSRETNGATIYSKEISVMMAGIAIVLMMILHYFIFQSWLDEGVSWHSIFGWIGDKTTSTIAQYGGVCVNFFGLTSGYVLIANAKAYATQKVRSKRLLRFLVGYWVTCALFLLIGALNNDTMPNIQQLLYNLVGMNTGPLNEWINVPFAWYVVYYIEFIMLIPILLWLYKGKNITKDLAVTACIIILLTPFIRLRLAEITIEPFVAIIIHLWVLQSTCIGIVIAKYSLFDKAHKLIGAKLPLWSLILLVGAVFIFYRKLTNFNPMGGVRWHSFTSVVDTFLAPVLMALFIEILVRIKSKYLKHGLCILGKYSMYLWFLHGIFFTGKNIFQAQIYSLQDPILIIAVSIIVLLPVSYILDKFVSLIFSAPIFNSKSPTIG